VSALSVLLPKCSIWFTIEAVVWSFLGIRKIGDFLADVGRLNPLYIFAVGFLACFLFVLLSTDLVHWVVPS
jgi:hypothetical protein